MGKNCQVCGADLEQGVCPQCQEREREEERSYYEDLFRQEELEQQRKQEEENWMRENYDYDKGDVKY